MREREREKERERGRVPDRLRHRLIEVDLVFLLQGITSSHSTMSEYNLGGHDLGLEYLGDMLFLYPDGID